ncbi:copper chaperone PCu(A)C [Paracoccus limosus]|jgi:copper(I)-binding protein|uniref:Copper chaperone PCu(A)C n=1 Tax=Paracoccus limosus TaxID=913252 RepID=A0A844H410_9RHOB|nr:copper chaperone PCu(A)C [Paracoccus limosus]MTH33981.1 copper chaperone PCu(A)C [Paracoccus limosus]
MFAFRPAAPLFSALFLGLALAAPAVADPVHQGDLTLSDAYMRAMPPHAPVAGAYVTIANAGSAPDRLISASSPRAGQVRIDEMIMQGEVMKMRALPDGLPIPAGETVTLQPGGYHLMFLEVPQSFTEGDTVEATLVFERAGRVTLPFEVRARAATSAGHGAETGHSGH